MMRPKRPNAGAYVCALASVVVLSTVALAPASAFALNPERHYEMVSPPYKGGYSASSILATAPDGESVAFQSLGGFADLPWDSHAENLYLARRGEQGWTTTSLQPPPVGEPVDVSASLDDVLGGEPIGPSGGASAVSNESELLLHSTGLPDTAPSWEVFGGIVIKRLPGQGWNGAGEISASGDLCHVLLSHSTGPLVREAIPVPNPGRLIYDLSRGCGGGSSSLQLVGVKNRLGPEGEPEPLEPQCPVGLGGIVPPAYIGPAGQESTFNAISQDGSEIFFTTSTTGTNDCISVSQLFVRVGGGVTLEVSRPLEAGGFGGCGEDGKAGEVPGEVPCRGAAERPSAFFDGASEDGSRVFFTTDAQLVGEDHDTMSDLYMASIGCPAAESGCEASQRRVTSLKLASLDENAGEAAEVLGVVRVAADANHVYFVARGALGKGANAEGRVPVKGADNLYVYDSETGEDTFIVDLCSGPGVTGAASISEGAVEDRSCPSTLTGELHGRNDTSLWGTGQEAQSTPDGSVLVFSSYGRLTKDDTDTARDIYRYDALTGSLLRVSIGEEGHDTDGNNDAFDASIPQAGIDPGEFVHQDHEMSTRIVSADGSRIVFTTADPLSVNAVNGLSNVYEWYEAPGASEGVVSLVSTGSSSTADSGEVISPSGRDIFFITSEGLVSQDTDGQGDIYDARLGGGFPVAPAPRQPCSGDACQGPLTNPAPLLVPGSVSQAPGGNFAAPSVVGSAVKAKNVKRKPKRRHKPARKAVRRGARKGSSGRRGKAGERG